MSKIPDLTAIHAALKAGAPPAEYAHVDTVIAVAKFALETLDRIATALEDLVDEQKAG